MSAPDGDDEHRVVRAGDDLRTFRANPEVDLPICVECGNDHVCEGYTLCSECLEQTT